MGQSNGDVITQRVAEQIKQVLESGRHHPDH